LILNNIASYGIPNADLCLRTPTFTLSFEGRTPKEVARVLGGKNICTWSGHLYADKLIDALSLSNSGGVLRVGLTHYNTVEEVDRFFDELSRMVGS
jgi:selenocysteine lyase/cysteine desulfurase